MRHGKPKNAVSGSSSSIDFKKNRKKEKLRSENVCGGKKRPLLMTRMQKKEL